MSPFLFMAVTLLSVGLPTAEATSQTMASTHATGIVDSVRPADTGSATSSLLKPARLHLDAVPLATAVAELAERSGVLIAYSPSRLANERDVDCRCVALTVGEALDHLLASTAFRYKEIDGYIVIIPRAVALPARPQDILPPTPPRLILAQLIPAGSARRTIPAAQEATITGIVTDAGTGQPLSGASVQVEGQEIVGISSSTGRFTLTNVPAGTHSLVASMIGYSSQRRTVTVAAGATSTVNFTLGIAPLGMDQLVVTATGVRRRTEVANVVGTVDAPSLVETVPITSMSQLLTARSPGVQVVSVGGTVGAQSRIRIRGQSSMSLSNDPIVYVDGIRAASGYGGGMDTSSRLDDLNPADIRAIDILKGPAAVALYGTDAANGVLIITTKRGGVSAPQWSVSYEYGILEQPSGFPSAFYAAGPEPETGQAPQCLLVDVAAGTCVQSELRSLNLLEDPESTPFATGQLNKIGVQLSGGADWLRYFVSADFADEIGTLRMPKDEQERLRVERGVPVRGAQRVPNSLRAANFRSNISAAIAPTADLDISFGYTDRDHQLTTSGGSIIFGLMRNALQGRGYRDALGGWALFPAGDLFSVEEVNHVDRIIGGIGATWRPLEWLQTRARAGVDRVGEENSQLQRREEGMIFSNFREGRKTEGRITQSNYTMEAGATANFDASPAVTLRSSVGGQYFRSVTRNVNASGTVLSPGTEHIGGTAVRTSNESNSGSANLGAFAEQMVGVNDRLFLTGSLRTDQNSAFGKDFDAALYPRASASWVVSQEPFFPGIHALNMLRLRLAYGMSGVSPGTLHALRFFTAVQTFEDGVARPGLQFHAIGNADLEPERTAELEAGFDIELFAGRASLELTHYRKRSRDALVNRPLAPSLGLNSPSRFENIGSVENIGWESRLFMRLLEGRSWGWDITLSGSDNTNELVRLGEGVTPVTTFAGTRAVEGYPLWGRWARPITGWADTDGNGIIEPDEVQVGEDAVFLGRSTPTREAAISSDVTALNGVLRFGALFDYRGGHLAYNRTEVDRCTAARNCRAVNDPTAPLWEQARAVAASSAAHGRTHAGYFEDGAYVTLRELSLSVQVPQRYTRLIRAGGATVSLAGRNLHTWTDYTGLSPEGSWVDNMGLDMNLVPLTRYWTIRVNATY